MVIFAALAWGLVGCATSTGSEVETESSSGPDLVGAPSRDGAPSAESVSAAAPDSTRAESRPASSDATNRGRLWYRIELSTRALKVRLRLLEPPEHTHFFLPSASSEAGRLDDRFHVDYARGPDRRRPHRIHRRRGRIDVDAGDAPWIELVYRVRFGSGTSGATLPPPRMSDGTLLAYAPTFLIVPSRHVARPVRDVPVEVHAPDSWQMLSTWPRRDVQRSTRHEGRRVFGFVPRTFQQLRDAFLVSGDDLTLRHHGDGSHRIDLAFDGSYRTDREPVRQLVVSIVEYYRRRFGELGPVSVYIEGRGESGDETRRGTSRRGGFVVTLPADRPPGPREALLVAHEAFHLWNGHALVPSPDRAESTRWFMEGVTQYVALKTVRRLGLLELDDALDELARSAAAYLHNPAVREGRASRFERRRLPYDRGLLLALAFDAVLAKESGDQIGIETWFHTLLEAHRSGRRLYDLETLEDALTRISKGGGRAIELWQRHVERHAPLAPHALFESVGLRFLSKTSSPTLEPLRPTAREPALYQALLPGPRTPSPSLSFDQSDASIRSHDHE